MLRGMLDQMTLTSDSQGKCLDFVNTFTVTVS